VVGDFDQPDDGMMDLQVAEIDVKDGTLRVVVHIENDKPAMVGKMGGKGDVKGALERGPVQAWFEMKRGVLERKGRPQDPVAPLP